MQTFRLSAQPDLLALRDLVNPPAVRRSRSLTAAAKEVTFAIWSLAGYRYGLLNLRIETIAAEIGRTADAVRDQVGILAEREILTQVIPRSDGTLDLAIDDFGVFGWVDPADRDRPLFRFDDISIEDAPSVPRVDLPVWLRDRINPHHVRTSKIGAFAKECFYEVHLAFGCAFGGDATIKKSSLVAAMNADRKSVDRAIKSLVHNGYLIEIRRYRGFAHLHIPEPGIVRVEAPTHSQGALLEADECGIPREECHIDAGGSTSGCGLSAEESHNGPQCADEVSAKVAEIVGRKLGQVDRLVTFDGSTRFAAEDDAFVVTAGDESRCKLLRATLLWPVLRPAVTAVLGPSTPIRILPDPALQVCGNPPEDCHKWPLKYLSLKSSELPASRGSSEGTEDLKRASVCGFSPVESHKPLAKRVNERALAIRVALGAPTFFQHWRPVQAALAVECGQLDAGDLDALLDHCAQKADRPFAMFARRIPIVFAQAGLVWLDEAEFKGVARDKLGVSAWDHPWPVAYPRRAKPTHARDPPRSA
ncbi:MAG TPA: hypothetical protein VFH56_17135 [Acidimicrobiales bacterium]|nr:hypothetical protein [Acidimicrobiales bacterium]